MKLAPLLKITFTILSIAFANILIAQTRLTFKNIPVVYNLDSIENIITQSKNKNNIEYINNLIIIERNRHFFSSYLSGKYCPEIDSLSKLVNYKFGEAFAAFILAIEDSKTPVGNAKMQLLLTHKALSYFTELKDTTGMIQSHLIFGRNYLSQIIVNGNVALPTLNKKKNLEIVQTYSDSISHHFSVAEALDQKNPSHLNHMSILYVKSMIYSRMANLDTNYRIKILQWLDSAITITENDQSIHYRLPSLYYLKGFLLFNQHKLIEGVGLMNLALKLIPNQESEYCFIIPSQLARVYYFLDKIDSANYLHLQSLKIIKQLGVKNSSYELENYFGLAMNYEEKLDFKNALKYQKEVNTILKNINQESLDNSIKSFKDYELITQQEVANNALKAQKKQAEYAVWIGSLLLIILGASTFFALRSRNKLNESYVKIQELQASRETFYSIISHDLRSPLNSYQDMAGTVSFLLKEKNYSQIEKIALQIDKTGLLLKNLLQNLFQWSLSQKEHLAFNKETIHVKECIDQVTLMYAPIAEAKNIQLNISTDEDQQIKTDKNYFTTILRNLIDNAIKNSNPGTAILLKTTLDSSSYKLSVQNHASISEEKFNIIQSMFASQKEWQVGEQGLGLGLILIKEFSKKMGATIQVSKVNDQLRFEFSLPV